MKILFFGSGVIGSIIAARLGSSGHDITVLARGERLRRIREGGIVVRDGIGGETLAIRPRLVERLDPDDFYDLAVVPVRADHLDAILPVLAANRAIRDILIMVNNPKGYGGIVEALGRERFFLGFPGMGGGLSDNTVTYTIANRLIQPTTLGETDGSITPRLRRVAAALRGAGFPVAVEGNMEAWQKTHVCWILPLAAALYMAGTSPASLAGRSDILRLMLRSIRECFAALHAIGVPVTPSKLRVFELMPGRLMLKALSFGMARADMEFLAALHVRNAPGEMRLLADGLMELVRGAGVKAPALEAILAHIPAK
jgi:2-dehydropantoate 2-reductase